MPSPTPNFRASLPVEKPTQSYWLSEPDPIVSDHQSHDFPTRADVVIIGSGLSGAFIAHNLLKSGSPRKPGSVVVLEARTAGSGASGRNGGHIKPDCYRGFSSYAFLHGPEVAKAQCELEAANRRETVAFIRENGLAEEVDLAEHRSADVYLTEKAWKAGLKSYNDFKAAGGDVSEIHPLGKTEAEEQLRITSCYGAITFPAASLWPYRLAMAVLRKALALGLQLHTNTPVTDISPESSGSWKVSTSRGDIIATHVIHATNGYASYLLPELDGRILPLKGHAAAITPHPAYVEKPLSTSFAFFCDEDFDYLIQRPDAQKYLIWGGGEVAHPDGLDGGLGDCDDSTTVAEINAHIENAPTRIFRGWGKPTVDAVGTTVPFVWSGIMGLSKDLLPFLGPVPGKPGQHLAAGYHGHGMARVFLSCKAFCENFLGEVVDPRVPSVYFKLEERLREPVDLELMEGIS